MATLSFVNAYAVNTATTEAGKEANDLAIVYTNPLNGAIVDDGGGATFSGNDVAVELEIEGVTYFGWISRPIKDGQVVNAFYFWSDPFFTDLATTAADNSDPDSDSSNNIGFVLVVDQASFDANLITVAGDATLMKVKTSSDGVARHRN
jgi:large repetitive protein